MKISFNFGSGKLILCEMKRINAFVVALLSVCFVACRQQPVPSGMEKAFGFEVGKTTLEEFYDLFPEDSYEYGLSWISPGIDFLGIEPSEKITVFLKEGTYRGTDYHRIGLEFDNRVLSEISFFVHGSADQTDSLIASFREEFAQYYDCDYELPASMAGMDHLQVFFNDGLTTLMLWRKDWSQARPDKYNPTTEVELAIHIMNTGMKKDWIKSNVQRRAKKVRRK